jgi:hypothetical protein
MQLSVHEKELMTLSFIGVLIGLGKLLISGERLSVRLVIGRMITGAALSVSAGTTLIMVNDMRPTALVGVASTIGILGQSVLEAIVYKFLGKTPDRKNGNSVK